MHDIDTTRLEVPPPAESGEGFEFTGEFSQNGETAEPLGEVEELELATELLAVSSEAELDQFIGKLFKKAWRGIRKVGSTVARVARPFAGVLKGLAKKALPFVGGALGSFIPIPGVGTAVGSALGSAVGNALEAELEGLSPEDREFEMARRFVRLATHATQRLAQTAPTADPRAAIVAAIKEALAQLRGPADASAPASAEYEFEAPESAAQAGAPLAPTGGRSGRWVRRGSKIILLGV